MVLCQSSNGRILSAPRAKRHDEGDCAQDGHDDQQLLQDLSGDPRPCESLGSNFCWNRVIFDQPRLRYSNQDTELGFTQSSACLSLSLSGMTVSSRPHLHGCS